MLTRVITFVLGAILIGGGITFSKRAYDLDLKAVLDPMSLGIIAALIGAWLCYGAIFGTFLFDW